MVDEVQVSDADAPEVVETEAEQVEAVEEPEETEGQSEDVTPAEDEGDEPEAKEKLTRHQRRKAQMEQLRADKQAAEAKLNEKRERLAKAEEAAQGLTPPKEADFQDYQEYLVALGGWTARQEWGKQSAAEIQREADEAQQQIEKIHQQSAAEARQNWADQADEGRRIYKDFDAVVSAPDLPITDSMAAIIAASDVGADVAYYLGTNKAYAQQVSRMSPIEQAVALGRLEATVSKPKPRTQSQAPDPIAPVRPKATGVQKDPSKMSMAEYAKWRKGG